MCRHRRVHLAGSVWGGGVAFCHLRCIDSAATPDGATDPRTRCDVDNQSADHTDGSEQALVEERGKYYVDLVSGLAGIRSDQNTLRHSDDYIRFV